MPASIFEANHMASSYDFGNNSLDNSRRKHIEEIVSTQKSLMGKQHYQEAVSFFRNAVPLLVPPDCSKDYYQLVAKYQLALGLCALGEQAEAAHLMNETGTMSCGERENPFFSEHQYFALYLRSQQEAAMAAGKPSVILTALPRSASGFLSYAIAEILGVPVLRASMGSFPHHAVVRNWAQNIAQGGAVTHEHFDGSEQNINQLLQAGVKKIYVQIRDPRAAAWSYLHHTASSYRQRGETVTLEDIMHTEYYPHAIAWIESWLDAQKKFKDEIAIEFLPYDEVVGDTRSVLLRLLTGQYQPEIDQYMKKTVAADFKPMHFRKGQQEEWRSHFSETLQEEAWSQTPQEIRELLKMKR
ncbi:MAG: hypothetical protein SFX19_07650 [Alphaproteobacteria bacterium]|nr:hypothetical protein [Alphaproteobacteria bacterium]